MNKINKRRLPSSAGVYLFKDKNGKIIYIGKSSNLKARISSYFAGKEIYSPLKRALVENLAKVEYKTTSSEIEALVLESKLIKLHQPKYNIMLRDDSQYFYVVLTKEEFPRVLITHQAQKIKNAKSSLGPFTEGRSLKSAMKVLRKIFPFKTCKNPVNKPCLDYELGLCPAHLVNFKNQKSKIKSLKASYLKNLKNLFLILKNKKSGLIKQLEKEMRLLAKKRLYEEADRIKKQIDYLRNVFDHEKVLKEELIKVKPDWPATEKELRKILNARKHIVRLESYDISDIQGKFAVGSMAVFVNGKPAKSEYRRFKIRTKTKDDISRLNEVLLRRLNRKDWRMPEAILIDGGKAQLNVLIKALSKFGLKNKIKAAALAKKEEKLYVNDGKILNLKQYPALYPLLTRLRNEAHRFANQYHRKKRKF